MNLECLSNIIPNNLAINIDLTNINSWINYNTGLTATSLTKWSNAISDNINLIDFGLTEFDNGRTNIMWSGITLMPKDTLFSMYKVGYNLVFNPISGDTSGCTVITEYLPMSATSTTGGSLNYFDLSGGYLQGFFKLDGYNYELLSSRYNNGITIETLLYLYPNSQGIFYMMGARAEDKYNEYFTGETISGTSSSFTGITTSVNNYLNSFEEKEILKSGFNMPENNKETIYVEPSKFENIKNNVIAFEFTPNKKLAYKYIDNNGFIVTNSSPTIISNTGYTLIDIVYTPNNIIDDLTLINCTPQRFGKLIFYVNGRAVWILNDFPEYYFKSYNTNSEKQIGVPYSISWGGGSFGLEHSWHYDYKTYVIYNGQDNTYINDKFLVIENPISTNCYIAPTGDTYLSGLSLSANNSQFNVSNICNPETQIPITVMDIIYTGTTGNTSKYYIKFNQPISVLSNRNYDINLSLYNEEFISGGTDNKITILPYSNTTDVNIISDVKYVFPITSEYLMNLSNNGLHPWGNGEEYQYSLNGVIYYGLSGLPATSQNAEIVGYGNTSINNQNEISTGENTWIPLTNTFKLQNNGEKHNVFLGILIELNGGVLNPNGRLHIKDFSYTASDILVQDNRKDNLLIQQNFNNSFIGGIQKLRIYDVALTSPMVLHNSYWEFKNHPELNVTVNKGGRIIHI